MTESEAKTKWCPQSINTTEGFGSYSGNYKINRKPKSAGNVTAVDCFCIASECAWWIKESKNNGRCGAIK